MDWELTLQAVETIAVLAGISFGLVQLRQFRHQKDLQASIQLLQSMQAPQMAESVLLLYGLPDNLSGKDLRSQLGERFSAVIALVAVFDSLGPLVARGHVPLPIYAEFYRGATVVSWKKLRRFIEEERREGWTNLFEWLQWLAERMDELAPLSSDIPAFERFKTWRHGGDYDRLNKASGRNPI